MPSIKILHMYVDTDDGDDSFFHLLIDNIHFKYISIEADVYEARDFFPPVLISKLPSIPPGDWNMGHISKTESDAGPYFKWTKRESFAGITHTWHPTQVDFLSLQFKKTILPNVYEATCPALGLGEDTVVIAKLARFPWEIDYYNNETQAYSWIKGHGIGPKFLGHITEEGRVIGFLLEKVVGRHAETKDLERCQRVVARLHGLGLVHGDLNKYNFLVPFADQDEVCLIDFEAAKRCDDTQAMNDELQELSSKLQSTGTAGLPFGDDGPPIHS
ncbi:MAG: hypothetical protein M4579_005035 [Chaenotheca gracillima]|nr:MAG: hypothetical protein M4579_005035 [Chaenotheca gracillima]